MTKQLDSYQIGIYLADLEEIRKEHEESAETCPDCSNRVNSGDFGGCSYKATIAVEIMTYQRKLAEIV